MHAFSNDDVAHLLRKIALYLQMTDDVFRWRAYEKAANSIESLTEHVTDIYRRGGVTALQDIEGVGEGIAGKIEELLTTGKMTSYEKLKKKVPVDIDSLTAIEGLGPKKILALYKKLKIKNVADLEKAAKTKKIRKLPGFGEKTEQNMLKNIAFHRSSSGRFILGHVLPHITAVEHRLAAIDVVDRCVVAGSVRRRKETVGDADLLVVSSRPERVMDFFVKMPDVVNVIAKGETKSSVKLRSGLNVDVRVVPKKSFGAALNYFTGSKDHNVTLRAIAKARGYKLSEYGLFKGEKLVAGATESDVYRALGLAYVEPELRENQGEIEAARKKTLPHLIDYNDLKGDLQVQTSWTDGTQSISEMALAAQHAGLDYICITDHTKSLAMTGGLDEAGLAKQGKEIERVQKEVDIRIFRGAEVNILKDGRLDIADAALRQLDIVGIAVHSHFSLPEAEMTRRIKTAMENEHADILFHPTGRIIQRREPYALDIDAIIDHARSLGTVLEIDAYPDRMDLKDEHVRLAVRRGVRLCIDSDAHASSHFSFLPLGIATARRGWATKSSVINALPLKKFEALVATWKQ